MDGEMVNGASVVCVGLEFIAGEFAATVSPQYFYLGVALCPDPCLVHLVVLKALGLVFQEINSLLVSVKVLETK